MRKLLLNISFILWLLVLSANLISARQTSIDTDLDSVIDRGLISPDLALPNPQGDIISLRELRGQDILLVFGSIHCPHCADKIPFLNELDGNGFNVVFIAIGCTRSDAVQYIQQKNIQFDVLLDSDGSVAKVYGVQKVPEVFIIDPEGIVQYCGPDEEVNIWRILAGNEIIQEIPLMEDSCESSYLSLADDCEKREPYLTYEPTVVVKPNSHFSIPVFVDLGNCPQSDGVYYIDYDEDGVYDELGHVKKDSFVIKGKFKTQGNHKVKGKVESTYGKTYFSIDVYTTEEKKTTRQVRKELYPGLYRQSFSEINTMGSTSDGIRKRSAILISSTSEDWSWANINLAYHVLRERFAFTDEELVLLTYNNIIPDFLTNFDPNWIDGTSSITVLENIFQDLSEDLDGDDLLFFIYSGHGSGYYGPRTRRPYFCGSFPDSIYEGPIDPTEYDDPDYKESEFQTEFIKSGTVDYTKYGVPKGMNKFLPCFYHSSVQTDKQHYRFKVVSHFDDLILLDGSTISDNDIYLEKIISYAKCDLNRNTIIEADELDLCDWDGDGVTLMSGDQFDEDDWFDKFSVEEGYHPYSWVNGLYYYCFFDKDLNNTMDMMGFESASDPLYLDCLAGQANPNDLVVTASDTDNNGYANYLDINLDGDLEDWLSFDEDLSIGTGLYDDELANLFGMIDPNTTKIFITESCFGGGFLRDLSSMNTIAISGSEEDDTASANGLMYPFFVALNGSCEQFGCTDGYPCQNCNGKLADIEQNLDLDEDGLVSIAEAFRKSFEISTLNSVINIFMYDDNGDLVESDSDSLTFVRDLPYSIPDDLLEGIYGDTVFLDPNFFGDINNVACYDFDGPLNFASQSQVISNGVYYNDYIDSNEIVDYICDGNEVSKFAVRFTVYFADANLKSAVEAELGFSDPNKNEIQALTSLDASSSGIIDLTGLEYCTNLTLLDLTNNPLNRKAYCDDIPLITANNPGIDLRYDPDPDPLSCPVHFEDYALQTAVELELGIDNPNRADMLDLTTLWASSSNITKLTGLQYATNLTGLRLGNNNITDISPITSLNNLEELKLYRNKIMDISVLCGLTNLISLYLYDNQITDIDSLAELTNLRTVSLHNNRITDISVLNNLVSLQTLSLHDNQITDISALSGLANLRYYLYLSENQISNIPSLSLLTNLLNLDLSQNQINNITSLPPNLTSLDLSENQITDISPLASLNNLTKAYLNRNQVSDLSPISNMVNLTEIPLHYNQISDLSALSQLENLEKVNLQNNQISDISMLSDANSLTWLGFNDNYLNTSAYCEYLPEITANNPEIDLRYDTNPNPLTNDCSTDLLDFSNFALYWLENNCSELNDWCGWSDLDHINDVNVEDLAIFYKYWLAGVQ